MEKEKRTVISIREVSPEEIEVIPDGSISQADVPEFQAWLDKALHGRHRLIALNFARVTTVCSSAIGKIVNFKKACDEMNRRLVIRHCSPEMLSLLTMIKFHEMVKIEA